MKNVDPQVFWSNIEKALTSFQKLDRIEEGVHFLIKIQEALEDKYTLYINYKLAKLSLENQVSIEEGKKALAFCKNNYKENRLFSLEDLYSLEE